VYEGQIWDRFLKIQLSDGLILPIDDLSGISGELEVGNRYELLLNLTVAASMKYQSPAPPTLDVHEATNTWGCIVVETEWHPPKNPNPLYRHYSRFLYWPGPDKTFVLVKTAFGRAITNPKEVEQETGKEVEVGGFLQIEKPRLDLYAILR
jgi:hypothetical protein